MKTITSILLFLLSMSWANAQSNLLLIPYPEKVEKNGDGSFLLSPLTGIQNHSSADNNAFLRDFMEQDFLLVLQNRAGKNRIVLNEDPSLEATLGKEGYTLVVDKDQVIITGTNATCSMASKLYVRW